MVTVNINWSYVSTIVAALAGIAGVVVTPIYGTGLAGALQGVITAIAGVLVLLPVHHVATVAVTTAKARALARLVAPQPGPIPGQVA